MVRGALLLALALLGAAPAAAGAHAMLEGTTPERGARLEAAPHAVAFRFSEPVESGFGAVRVFDAVGRRVDDGRVSARGPVVSAGLREGLRDGGYVATYRVISADGHPVSGGVVFSVGSGGPAAGATVGELLDASAAGPATEVAYGVARGAGYAAIALGAGGLLFLLGVWRTSLREQRRARRLLLGAAAVGAASSAAAIVLQGAVAGGTSLWAALDAGVVGDVLATHTGRAYAVRLAAALALGGAIAAGRPRAAVVPAAALVVTPALAGHATTQDPTWLLAPLDVLHVTAMSAWLGGLAFLLVAVPSATKRLDAAGRSGLLAGLLSRFSALALTAVVALIATGAGQAIVHLERLGDLTATAFGRALVVKSALLCLLVALGAVNRRRVVPALRRLAATGQAPGGPGRLLRRALRAEVALLIAVLGVTSALVSYPRRRRSPPARSRAPRASAR